MGFIDKALSLVGLQRFALMPTNQADNSKAIAKRPDSMAIDPTYAVKGELTAGFLNPMYSIFDSYLPILNNPDDTLQLSPGKSNVKEPLMIYHKIEQHDSRFRECLEVRRNLVLSAGFDVYNVGKEEHHKETTDFTRWVLFENDLLVSALRDILDAYGKGFSVSELIFQTSTFNKSPRLIVSAIKHREPWQFMFDKDLNLRQLTPGSPFYGEIRPKWKHLIFSYNGRYENPYGESLIGYWGYKTAKLKDDATHFWTSYLNRLGIPPQRAFFPPSATDKMISAMKLAMQELAANTSIMIPEGWQHEIINIPGQAASTDAFKSLIDYCDKIITITILGQMLSTETDGKGSYSLAKIQQSQLNKLVKFDCQSVARVVNEQVIKPLIKYNYGDQDYYPYIAFDDTDDQDIDKLSTAHEKLFNMGLAFPKSYLHETYGVPEPQEGDPVYQKSTQPTAEDTEDAALDIEGLFSMFAWKAEYLDETENEIRARVEEPGSFISSSFRRIAIDEEAGIYAIIGKKKGEQSTTIQSYRFEKPKWNKEKCISWLDKHKVSSTAKASMIYEDTTDAGFVSFTKIEEIEKQRTTAIDKLYSVYKSKIIKAQSNFNNAIIDIIQGSTSYEELNKRLSEGITLKNIGTIAKAMAEISFYVYLLGRYAITQDMRDAVGQKYFVNKKDQLLLFADETPPDFLELTGQVLPYDKAIKTFAGKTSMGDSEFKKNYDGIYNRYFTIAGIDSQNTLDQIKSIVEQSLKTGTSYGDFKANARDVLNKAGVTAINDSRLQLVYQNATLGSYGKGRLDELQSDAGKSLFPYWQYVAVMDNRTRPEHGILSGTIRPSNDSWWVLYYPPWAHRCRCTVVGVTEYQIEKKGLKVTESPAKLAPSDFQNPMQNYMQVSKDIGSPPVKVAKEVEKARRTE